LADAADDMWAFAHSKSIAIVINAQVENYWISVDRSLLVRAIGNLLSNAIKFSPPGSQVVCTAKPIQTDSGGYIICSISDQGKGIEASEHTAIFSPFQRAAEQGRDGIGLGLAFVKMVIERHGGTIDVNSVLGKGSIFTITLPCVIEANEI
jgi:signal transduction histidine kinase